MNRLAVAIVILTIGAVPASAQSVCDYITNPRKQYNLVRSCINSAAEDFWREARERNSPEAKAAEAERARRERAWTERCKPFKRRDANGIDRLEYAHPDCAGSIITSSGR